MVISFLCTAHYCTPPTFVVFSIHTLIIAAEMLFAVTSAEFTTPSAAFAYCLIWVFPIEAFPQLLMAPVFHGLFHQAMPSTPSPKQCPDKSNEVNSWPSTWIIVICFLSAAAAAVQTAMYGIDKSRKKVPSLAFLKSTHQHIIALQKRATHTLGCPTQAGFLYLQLFDLI